MRTYPRKDGTTECEPYWHFRPGGGENQRILYLGKIDEPEAAQAAKR